jgi:NAD(P)-dependent dehydrogenase (short-subunit alcohol dehydrogenase family)
MAFAREGARVLAVGRRLEKVQETADLISREGGACLALAVDVSRPDDVARMMDECRAGLGDPAILVNNAGVHVPGGVLETEVEQWDWVLAVNLRGTFLCSKAVLPGMLQKGWGRIINIASASAITPSVNAAYCASKGGIVSLTRSMALQLSPRGITVNAIAPGPVFTEMTNAMFDDPHVRQHVLGKSLVGKIGEPSDIAAGAVYLASDEASFVSGSVLAIG